jgi:hypothetical protein
MSSPCALGEDAGDGPVSSSEGVDNRCVGPVAVVGAPVDAAPAPAPSASGVSGGGSVASWGLAPLGVATGSGELPGAADAVHSP